jgi:predicted Holliday junction resolvase-like endonuclease
MSKSLVAIVVLSCLLLCAVSYSVYLQIEVGRVQSQLEESTRREKQLAEEEWREYEAVKKRSEELEKELERSEKRFRHVAPDLTPGK